MTRKDYIRLADELNIERRAIIRDAQAVEGDDLEFYACAAKLDGFDKAVDTVVDALKRENPRFDRLKFYDAVRSHKVSS